MALIWSKKTDNTVYEVRSAGNSLRLYTNGVFHSQWNPNHLVTGHVWDLLVLPAFIVPAKELNTALILGVGGGAAIRALNHLFALKHVVGVDLDPTHLHVAKRFFKCNHANTTLVHAEAMAYVKRYKRKYDYIVEDIFIENPHLDSDAIRAIEPSANWFTLLSSRLTQNGLLVSNFESKSQLDTFLQQHALSKLGFKQVYCLQSLQYENGIALFTKKAVKLDTLHQNMNDYLGEAHALRALGKFIIQKL